MTEAAKDGFNPIDPPPPYSGPPEVGPLPPVDQSDPTAVARYAKLRIEKMKEDLKDIERLGRPGTRPRVPVHPSAGKGE